MTRKNKYKKNTYVNAQEISHTQTRSIQNCKTILESAECAYKISLPHIFEETPIRYSEIIVTEFETLYNQISSENHITLCKNVKLTKSNYG